MRQTMVQMRLVLFAVFTGLGLTSVGQLAQPSGAAIPGSPAWVTKIEADAPAKAGASDPTYGAESNPTGEPIGGGTGYSRLVLPGAATTTVQAGEELVAALAAADAGTVIYVADGAQLDMTPYQDVTIPGGVTLAGGRGRDGGEGALVFTKTVKSGRLFRTGGANIRLTGLRFEGSHPGRERLTQRPNFLGVYHPNVEVDNCEIFAWSCAAVGVGSGAEEGTWVHHNYIHHNQRAGLGYGVSLGRVHVLIEGNLFDFCRHAIASSGVPGSGYTARYNVHLENTISHVFDMHGARDFEKYKQVGLWHLDEGRGMQAGDSSIYNGKHPGRLVGAEDAAWVDGRTGRALKLDGRDDYVDAGKRRELSPRKGLTASAWIKPDTTEGTQAVLSKADTGATGSGYALRVVDGCLEATVYGADGTRITVSSEGLAAGVWQHVGMTWNRKEVVVYLNGKRVAGTPSGERSISGNRLLFGRDSATATSFYRGAIDEVRVYNVAMTPDDIQRHADGHGDIAGRLLLMHHNTIRATNYAALAVRGRPSNGCWVTKNRFYAPEDGNVARQGNATGNFHVNDNRYLGQGLKPAPDFSQGRSYGHWSFEGKGNALLADASGSGRHAEIELGEGEGVLAEDGEGTFVLSCERRWIEIPKAAPEHLPERVAIGVRMRVDTLREHQVLLDNGLFRVLHRGGWAGSRLYFLCRIEGGGERNGDSAWAGQSGVRTQRGIRAGEWFDLVGVRDGQNMLVYLNGKLERELACLSACRPADASRGALQVGRSVDGALDDLWIRAAPEPAKSPQGSTEVVLKQTGLGGVESEEGQVTPRSGTDSTLFHFRTLYRDAKGIAPAIGFPRLHILRDGRRYINEAPVTMLAADTRPFEEGRVYTYSMRLPRGMAYAHLFEAETADGRVVSTPRFDGPQVVAGNTSPVLSWTSQGGYAIGGVAPQIGDVSTEFDFRVLFSDLDGDLPLAGHPRIHVRKSGKDIVGSPFAMAAMNDVPTWLGRPYQIRLRLEAGEDYSYFFTGSDASGNEAPQSLTRRNPVVDAGKDIAPPDISQIGVEDVGPDAATVVWKTDENADSAVDYGESTAYGMATKTVEPAGTHRVRLKGLQPGTVYHYRVSSADASANRARSGNYTFRTEAE